MGHDGDFRIPTPRPVFPWTPMPYFECKGPLTIPKVDRMDRSPRKFLCYLRLSSHAFTIGTVTEPPQVGHPIVA